VPAVAVHVEPTALDPDTVGAAVFVGAVDTTAVELSAPARANPDAPLPATCTVRNLPPSAAVAVYVSPVAPGIDEHPAGSVVNPVVIGAAQRIQ
jgi:hypothetical protein